MKYNEIFATVPLGKVIDKQSSNAMILSQLCGVEDTPAPLLPLDIVKCGIRVTDFNGTIISTYAMVEIILAERKEN